jgi:Ca-activated chloride channel family protein
MSVNVVPGDEAAGRIPNPAVTTARLLADATSAKRDAGEALMCGDSDKAERLMEEQEATLNLALASIDDSMPQADELRARLVEEQVQLQKLARGARMQAAPLMAKSMMEDWSMESRGRNDQARRTRSRNKREW